MKRKFWSGLENLVSSAKTHWKEIVTAIALPFILEENANAGGLFLKINSSLASPKIYIEHINGATEDYGSYDALFLEAWPPNFYIYSKTSYPPPEDKLKKDARPPESMSTITSEIVGVGLSSPVTDSELDPLIYKPYGQDNFYWKNIIGELYNNKDVNDSNNLLNVYDMKHMDKIDAKIPLTINNGLSYQLLIKFFNHADLNRDRKVNGLDFAIWAGSFRRNNETDPNTFGSYVGSEPNNLGAYADIDRSGAVDYEDLNIFSGEWLYNANDPNTW